MQITKKVTGQFVVFTIIGNLDMNNVKFVKKVFDDEIAKGTKYIAIDMKSLNYIDSSGIGSFIGLVSRLRQVGGQVVLMNMSSEIERIFSMTKLLGFFKVFKNEGDFLKSAGAASEGETYETSTEVRKNTESEDGTTPSSDTSPDYSF